MTTVTGAGRRRASRATAAVTSLALAAAVVSALVAAPGAPIGGTPAPRAVTGGQDTLQHAGPGTTPRAAERIDSAADRSTGRTVDAAAAPTVSAPTVPAETVPATTVPATTVPATTVPATTVPATTVPATTVPETVPATTVPSDTVLVSTTPSGTTPSSLLSATTTPRETVATVPAPGMVTGTLTRVWDKDLAVSATDPDGEYDEAQHDEAQLLAWVEAAAVAYPVRPGDVDGVEDGSTVTVELAAAGGAGTHPARVVDVEPPVAAAGELLYGQGSQDLFGIAAAAVTHEVTVVLATPRGAARDSMTTTTLAAVVDGEVNTYWSQQTRGQRGFRVAARHDWQALTSTCADAMALWNEVAGRVGFLSGPRKHLLVYIPPGAGCGAGLGTIGSPDAGGRSWVGYAGTSIIAHELGHNLGLGHSNGLLCTGASDGRFSAGTWQAGCAVHDYRDFYDVMGVSWSNLGSLAAPQADALGVLRSTEKLTATAPVRVRLVPASSDGLRVLRVNEPGGAYYVEYRVAAGWDSWLASNWRGLDPGVIVHRNSPVGFREVLLLDGSTSSTPRTDDWAAGLRAGSSLVTASGSTRFVVEAADSTGATVAVWRDGVEPGSAVRPADGAQVEIQSPTGPVGAGTTVFSGVGTAPGGTLLWEVRQDGVVRNRGFTQTGANGTFGFFQVPVALPAGTFVFRVIVPDESDGEAPTAPFGTADQISLTVR